MDDLQKSQIHYNCKLAMPEGLQELMSDISREVLRKQPKNLLKFITQYLSALLVARENLATATRLCNDVCTNPCAKGLEEDLLELDINTEDIKTIKEIIDDNFGKMNDGELVKEGPIITKIMENTSIAANKLYDILRAIRKAFVRHQAYNTTIYEMTPDSSLDDVTRAARHTIDLYGKTKPTDQEFHAAAEKIQAAYRALGVTRQKTTEKTKTEWSYAPEIIERAELGDRPLRPCETYERHISFDFDTEKISINASENHYAESHSSATNVSEATEDVYLALSRIPCTVSSISLAGSHIKLPENKPYSVQDDIINELAEQDSEEGSATQIQELYNVDYTKQEYKDSNEVTEVLGQICDSERDDLESEEYVEEEIDDRTFNIISDTDDENDEEMIVGKTEYTNKNDGFEECHKESV